MVLTFYTWCRSLRNPSSWPIAGLAGLAYTYMVAAWGGYTFVLNMIGLHAGVLFISGRFSPRLVEGRASTICFVSPRQAESVIGIFLKVSSLPQRGGGTKLL